MWLEIVIWLEEDGTALLIHRNRFFHQNELSPLWYIYITDQWRIHDFPEEGPLRYDFAKFSQKLHEIERIWAPRGAHIPAAPP